MRLSQGFVLSVVLGTYNRLHQLKRCVESIQRETRIPTKVYVTDAGSTDGSIEYLQSIASDTIVPILVGKKLGQAKAYNDVFEIVETPYVCWLSDDNEVVDQGLDRAVAILQADPAIGMVALKTQDKQGPFVGVSYIGGISEAGILNVNQGMLPTTLLQEIGGFSEEFRDYGIDSALTAEVLMAGHKVVYTKIIALNHYRNWSEDPQSDNYQWLRDRHARAKSLYSEVYGKNLGCESAEFKIKSYVGRFIKARLTQYGMANFVRNSRISRDLFNILSGKYISILDPVLSLGKDYHLVQKMYYRGEVNRHET